MQLTADPAAARKKIAPRSIPEQIAETLSRRIFAGELPDGTHLKGPDLATEFEVSRVTIHDALRILERYGLAKIVPRRGAFVQHAGQSELSDILEIRAVLLGLAVRRACELATDEFARQLTTDVQGLRQLGLHPDTTSDQYGTASMAVQRKLAQLAGNSRLLGLLDELANRQVWPQAFRDGAVDHTTVARRGESAAIWFQLAEAIERRDANAAEQAGRRLVDAAREFVVGTVRER